MIYFFYSVCLLSSIADILGSPKVVTEMNNFNQSVLIYQDSVRASKSIKVNFLLSALCLSHLWRAPGWVVRLWHLNSAPGCPAPSGHTPWRADWLTRRLPPPCSLHSNHSQQPLWTRARGGEWDGKTFKMHKMVKETVTSHSLQSMSSIDG